MTVTNEQIIATARGWIGTPYRHQASVRGAGADCLGLVRGVWQTLYGTEPEPVPAYTADWSEPDGQERLWQAALRHFEPASGAIVPGDLLLFRMRAGSVAKHLGIATMMAGALSFVHAYSGHGVIESPLSTPWQRRIVCHFRFPQEI